MSRNMRGVCRQVVVAAAVIAAGCLTFGCDDPARWPLAPTPPLQGAASVPVILSVTPSTGSSRGGNSVTITGTGLVPGARVSFGSLEVPAHMDARTADKVYVVAPSHAQGAVDIVITNPDRQTAVASEAYTFAAPDSFDVDGEWSGGAITGHEPFTLQVVNRSVVSISCWTSGTVMLSPPAPITDGEFSYSGHDGVVISGTIVSPLEAKGAVTAGPCVKSDWYAFRK